MALILVIEDNAVNLELMTYLLQAHGYRTVSAGNGSAGLTLARQVRPDLIICDIQMPGLDGHSVAQALRADPALARLPLIAVTAAAMVGDRDRALASGFDAHVAKPIEPKALMALVESFLLPAAARAAPPAPGQSIGGLRLGDALCAPRDGIVLLMVDDQPVHLEYKRDLLEPAGYSVQTASDAASAWRCLQDHAVNLVLSDVVMPGIGGFALLQQVRADTRLAGMRFLFLTSTAHDDASKARGLALGADAYLIRPIEPVMLLQEIRTALDLPGRG